MPKPTETYGERLRALFSEATEGSVPPRAIRDGIDWLAEEVDTSQRIEREALEGLREMEDRAIKAEVSLEEANARIETLERVAAIAVELMEGLDDPKRLRPHLAWDLREATRGVSDRIDPVGRVRS